MIVLNLSNTIIFSIFLVCIISKLATIIPDTITTEGRNNDFIGTTTIATN